MKRRQFISRTTAGAAGITLAGLSVNSYGRIAGANDRIRVGVVGFADRGKASLYPALLEHAQELNFEIVAVSDIWNRRRDEAKSYFEKKGVNIQLARNNEELYEKMQVDAVIIATADFQHALHTIEAVKAGKDVYVEKPFAETMDDNNAALDTVKASKQILQVGSQRRSGQNYITAAEYIKSGKFGSIIAVDLFWQVNQPGRWRRPDLVASIKETDTDWKRYLLNRPYENWDARKYLEYRLFWPYSSGIPGQWMAHQIDTVHWFSGLDYPRSVAVNGGIYLWNDGRQNADTLTAVFDYGPANNRNSGFQVVFNCRMTNSADGVKELYYSNGGTLDLDTNMVTSRGGLQPDHAKAMGMQPNLLEEFTLGNPNNKTATAANTGKDNLTTAHMRNWMECIRSRKQPNANVDAAYYHSVACIMTNAAYRTSEKAVFDPTTRQVIAGGKVFKY